MSARPTAADRNPNASGTHRGPSAFVETTTTVPRTRKNRPANPMTLANVGPSASMVDGAVSAGGAPGPPMRIGALGLGSGVVLVLMLTSICVVVLEGDRRLGTGDSEDTLASCFPVSRPLSPDQAGTGCGTAASRRRRTTPVN